MKKKGNTQIMDKIKSVQKMKGEEKTKKENLKRKWIIKSLK